MRKAWLAALAGASLLVIGTWWASWIGPDDWLDSPLQAATSTGDVAVVTSYGLLSHTLPLRVSAEASGEDVFVGVGHAIDIDDYLAGSALTQVAEFSPVALRTVRGPSGGSALPAPPSVLDVWRQKASGPGVQSVSGLFAGQPVVAFIGGVSGHPVPLRVSVGSQLSGGFAAGVTAAGLGALVLVLVLVQWRGRRGGAASAVASEEPCSPPSTEPPGLLRVALVAILGLTLIATGCTGQPATLSHNVPLLARERLTRDPLEGLDLAAFGADYDRRNNAAIAAAAAPRYSAKEWEQADAGLLLAFDRYLTAWDRTARVKDQPASCHTSMGVGFPMAAQTTYPLTVILTQATSCGGKPPASPNRLSVYTRQHAFSAWIQTAEVPLPKQDPPRPGVGEPAPRDAERLLAAANEVANYISTGKVRTVTISASLAKQRAEQYATRRWSTSWWTAWLAQGATHVARTADGSVAVVSIDTHQHVTAKANGDIRWSSHTDGRVLKQPGWRETLDQRLGLTVALGCSGEKIAVISWNLTSYLG